LSFLKQHFNEINAYIHSWHNHNIHTQRWARTCISVNLLSRMILAKSTCRGASKTPNTTNLKGGRRIPSKTRKERLVGPNLFKNDIHATLRQSSSKKVPTFKPFIVPDVLSPYFFQMARTEPTARMSQGEKARRIAARRERAAKDLQQLENSHGSVIVFTRLKHPRRTFGKMGPYQNFEVRRSVRIFQKSRDILSLESIEFGFLFIFIIIIIFVGSLVIVIQHSIFSPTAPNQSIL
jgi:hypothetical protein